MRLVDLTQVIESDMPVYPGDRRTTITQTQYLDRDGYNNHQLETGMHSGTHIDGPMHLTESSEYIASLPLDSFIGTGRLLDVRHESVIKMKPEYEEIIEENSIVLLYTGYDQFYGTERYYKSHPVVDETLSGFLIERKVKMLGMDTPSPDRYPFPIHKSLLQNNIYLIENLTNLHELLGCDQFEVIALPLRIKADSSIARVAARFW